MNKNVKLLGLEVGEGELGGVFPFFIIGGGLRIMFIGEVVFLRPLNEGLCILVFPLDSSLANPLVHRLGRRRGEVSVLFSVKRKPIKDSVVMEEVFNAGGGEMKFHCSCLFCMNR